MRVRLINKLSGEIKEQGTIREKYALDDQERYVYYQWC